MRRWLGRALLALLGVAVFSIAGMYFLLSTQSGTRWLLVRATPYLPQALSISGAGGTLLSELTVDQLTWRDTGIDVVVEDVTTSIAVRRLFRGHVALNTLRVQAVSVASNPEAATATDAPNEPIAVDLPLRISVDAAEIHNIVVTTADRTTRLARIDLAGSASGPVLHVDSFNVASDWLQLGGKLAARLGPPYALDGELNWALEELIAAPLAGKFQINGDRDAYLVKHALSRPVEVQTEGTVNFTGRAPGFDLDSRWDGIEWPLDETQTLRSPSGRVQVSGSLERYAVDADTVLQLEDWPTAQIQIEGEGTLTRFDVALLRLNSELANLTANGYAQWSEDPEWQAAFDLSELQIDRLQTRLNGLVNASGTVQGRLPAEGALELQLVADTLSGELNQYPVNGALSVSLAQDRVDLADSWVAVRENRIDGRGSLAPEIDLALTWDLPVVTELLPEATGQSQGELSVRKSTSDWEIGGQGTASDVAWRNFVAGSLVVNGEVSTAGRSDASIEASGLRIGDFTIDTLNTQIAGVADNHRLEFSAAADDKRINILANGGYVEERWNGVLETIDFVDGERSSWSNEAAAALQLSEQAIDLELCLQEKTTSARLCADADYEQAGVAHVNATLGELELSRLPVNLLPENVDVGGVVEAEVSLTWQDELLNGLAAIQLDDATFTADYDGEALSAALERSVADITVTNNTVSAATELRLTEGGTGIGQLRITDITDSQSALEGSASVELTDLSFVPLFVPAVSATSGSVSGTLNLGGQLSRPTLGGNLGLSGGSFRANSAGISVTDINVQLRQAVNGQLSLEGSARSGDGEISVTGESRIDATAGLATSVELTGENFEFIRLPEWQAVASPNIQVTLDGNAARVRGKLAVPQAQVTLKSLPETAEKVSPDATIHGRETTATSASRLLDIDVETTLGERVQLTGFGLDTRLTGALRLRGGSREPFVGTGRIELRDGRYEAYGQELEIESGALLFSGPLTNPELDVRATRQVGDVVAGLNLSGTPSNLSSTVFSEPPLSDAEALSYLIAGRPLETADDAESNRVGQAAFALGLTGADQVIAQLQSKLGLDSLSLDSKDDVGRIVAGRRIGGRLLVEYGYGLVDRLGTLLLRYQLNERVIVETTTGTASTLDVVYSVKKE